MAMRPDNIPASRPARVIALLAALVCGATLFPADARAAISVEEVEYAAGVLVVRGRTSEASQRVTLNGRFSEWTDRNKRFRFRVRFLPPDCLVTLRAGREVHSATVDNCKPAGGPTAERVEDDRALAAGSMEPAERSDLRVVRQPCDRAGECRVLCREGEFAINAYCPGGNARLIGERTVSCAIGTPSRIVAYCMSPEGRQVR
jgi:hypothetical protein